MSFRATTLWRLHLHVLLAGLFTLPAMAQVANSPVVFDNHDGVKTSFVKTSNWGGSDSGATSDTNQWLKIEFHYSVTPAVGDFQNSVTFKVWVEGLDLLATDAPIPGKGVAVVMTGEVTYVNVPKGKDVYGVLFVPPSALQRYSTDPSKPTQAYADFDASGGAKFNVHAEADVDGKPVDVFDMNKEKDPVWYQPLRPVPGLIFLQNQSPFITTDPDHYPALKLPAANS